MALNKLPTVRNKLKVQNDALQKIFLLNEPTFNKVKEELDNEKYLSELDKQLKLVLNDKRLLPYKKWLKYKDLLIRFANFKSFLNESKSQQDSESVNRLQKIERKIAELEKKRVMMDKSTDISSKSDSLQNQDLDISEIYHNDEELYENSPNESNISTNESFG